VLVASPVTVVLVFMSVVSALTEQRRTLDRLCMVAFGSFIFVVGFRPIAPMPPPGGNSAQVSCPKFVHGRRDAGVDGRRWVIEA
jgi:hypothetical protein